MAEIKSTMERVMERAARFGAASAADLKNEELERDGMRLAAAFMAGEDRPFQDRLAAADPASLPTFRRGVVMTLLRNLLLPKTKEQLEAAERAIAGLQLVFGSGVKAILTESSQVVGRYQQHREQLRQQLETAFRQQMEQTMAARGGGGRPMTMDPALHPKFQEEWLRLSEELDQQYGRVLSQHKASLQERAA